MANCTAAEVRLIIDTRLDDTDVGSLITLADAEMTARGLTTRAANVKKTISMMLTAGLISLRDPTSKSLGEYRETFMSALDWREAAERMIQRTGPAPTIIANEPLPE